MVPSWLRPRSNRKVGVPRSARRHCYAKLMLERLEDRIVPSFSPTSYAAGAGIPAAVATGDFQHLGNGNVDFAVASLSTGGAVSVFLNNGSGTFQSAVNYPAGPNPVDIAVGDLNGDGLPDIVVANLGTSPGTVTILFNDPTSPGTFLPAVSIPLGQDDPRGVKLADMNGDGFLDIVSSNYAANSVTVLLNHGDGTFAAPHSYLAGSRFGTYALAVADFYGDGHQSVAVGNVPSHTVNILRGNGDGTLQPFTVVATPGIVTGLAAGDLGNGAQDLISANNNTGGITVLLNDGAGNFTPTNYDILPHQAPFRVALGDVNGDGKLDVVVANILSSGPGNISILYGNGDGTLQPPLAVSPAGDRPSGVAIADVDHDFGTDQLNDIIVDNNVAGNNVTVLQNSPAPIVVSTTLTGTFDHQVVSDGQIVFSDPIDPATFTPGQFVLTDPSGNPVHVTGVNDLDPTHTRFDITFDSQSTLGAYTLTLGPNIMDPTDTYSVPVFHSTFTITNNLLVNGGFETGDFTGWTQWGDPSFTGVETLHPHSGTHDAFFGPSVGLGGIMQDVATTPGQTYTLSLWLAHPFTSIGTEYQVQIGGTIVDDQINMANIPYTQFTYTYTATSTTTTIQLGFLEPPSYFYVDDVSFTPNSPAPAPHGRSAPAPHGGSGGGHLFASTIASGNATALTEKSPAPVGGSVLGVFAVPGQQHAVAVGASWHAGPSIDLSGIGQALIHKSDAETIGNVAQPDVGAYHVAAADVVFSDPLLGDPLWNIL
jgi:hypothetical protein